MSEEQEDEQSMEMGKTILICTAIQAAKGGDCHDLQGGRTSGHALYQWQHNG